MDDMADTQSRSSDTRLSRQEAINIALMGQDISNIKTEVQSISQTLRSDFVKKEEFEPVRNLVYGFVVLVVVAVVGAMIALVVIRPGAQVPITTTIPTGK